MLFNRLAILTVTGLCLAASGCGQGNKKADDKAKPTLPKAQDHKAEAYSPALSAEYATLPSSVVIAADLDEHGHPVASTAEMRAAGSDPGATPIVNADQAEAAYAAGSPVKTAASVDELDQDSSTQSWSDYRGATDFNRYQPQVYSQQQTGYTYGYGNVQALPKGNRLYYVYYRPACAPSYCQTDGGQTYPQQPGQSYPQQPGQPYPSQNLDATVRAAMQKYGVRDITNAEFYNGSAAKVELGGRLFYDKLLSANGDVACASCHVQNLGTTTFYSLGPSAQVMTGQKQGRFTSADLMARNAPALYNIGHKSLSSMFWDSRVAASASSPSGFLTPVSDQLPQGLDSALAAQSLFPLITSSEMGCGIAGMQALASTQARPQWDAVMQRVMARNDYRQMFAAAFPEANGQFGIEHLANAIASFESKQWRAINSPFDRYVRGDSNALTPTQKIGASYFYGKMECASCHAGPLLTDHGHHAIAMPQFGPGEGDGVNGHEDFGFGRVTGNPADNFKFKTPSLRNVSASGPWGHNGAYRSLRTFVEHYKNPRATHDAWSPNMAIFPTGFNVDANLLGAWTDPAARERLKAASEIDQIPMTDQEVEAVMQFLLSLTDASVAQNQASQVVQR